MPIGTIIWRTLLAVPLLSLFFIAFNFFGSIFWIGGFFIFIVALSHLLNELRKGRRRVPLLVLSLATVALFFGACGNHARAWSHLAKQTRAFAEEVQAQCNRDGACPSEEQLCTPNAYGCRDAGSLSLKLPIRYRVAEDKRSFVVSSSISTDDATSYEGGVSRPLTRRDLMDGSDINGKDAAPDVIVPFDGGAPPVDVDAGRAPSDGGPP